MKKILSILTICLIPKILFADSKVSALTEYLTPASTDFIYVLSNNNISLKAKFSSFPGSGSGSQSSFAGNTATGPLDMNSFYIVNSTNTAGLDGSSETFNLSSVLNFNAPQQYWNGKVGFGGGQEVYEFNTNNTNARYFIIRNIQNSGAAQVKLVADPASSNYLDIGMNGTTASGINVANANNQGYIVWQGNGFGIYSDITSGKPQNPVMFFNKAKQIGINTSTQTAYFTIMSTANFDSEPALVRISSPNGTNILWIDKSSFTLGVPLYGDGSHLTGTGGGSSLYPATATASFPFGLSASTIVVNGGNTGQIALGDVDGSNYVILKASNIILSSPTFVLPASTGAVGQVLTIYDLNLGTNTLYWTTPSAGGGSGGYSMQPATVALQANQGISASTIVVNATITINEPSLNSGSIIFSTYSSLTGHTNTIIQDSSGTQIALTHGAMWTWLGTTFSAINVSTLSIIVATYTNLNIIVVASGTTQDSFLSMYFNDDNTNVYTSNVRATTNLQCISRSSVPLCTVTGTIGGNSNKNGKYIDMKIFNNMTNTFKRGVWTFGLEADNPAATVGDSGTGQFAYLSRGNPITKITVIPLIIGGGTDTKIDAGSYIQVWGSEPGGGIYGGN